jgi:hypothetical protein
MNVSAHASIAGISVLDTASVAVDTIRTGDPLALRVECLSDLQTANVVVESFIYSADGRILHCQLTTALERERLDLPAGASAIEFSCAETPLQPGEYVVCASIRKAATQEILAWHSGPTVTVRPGRMVRGHFYFPHAWRQVSTPSSTLASR